MLKTATTHVLEALLNSPVAKEAEAKHANAIAARRAALAQDRAAIEVEAAKQFVAYYKAEATAFEKCQAAERALELAKRELGALIADRAGECYRLDTRKASIETELRETADPEIGRFIASMRDEWDRALKAQPEPETSAVRNPNTGKITHVVTGRRVKPADRVNAVRLAIDTAEALKLEPDQAGVAAKLDALRDGLPAIGAELKGAAQ